MFVVEAIKDWLAGPPLLPDIVTVHSGPECSETHCYDPLRVALFSCALQSLIFVICMTVCPLWSKYRALRRHDQIFFVSVCVSIITKTIVFQSAFRMLFISGFPMDENLLTYRSAMTDFYTAYAIGYYWHDFIIMHLYPSVFWRVEYFCHHIPPAIICPFFNYVTGYGTFATVFAMLMEGSTPFVDLRWLLSVFGYKQTPAYVVSCGLMMGSFFLVRICSMFWFFYHVAVDWEAFSNLPTMPIAGMIVGLGTIFTLNVVWFTKMIQGAILLYGGDKKKLAKFEEAHLWENEGKQPTSSKLKGT
jgi:hypothetical protein